MNTDDITRIMDKAKEIGIRSVDVKFPNGANLKFSFLYKSETFREAKFGMPVPDVKPEEIVKPISPLDDITPEEILYFAVPHYDEIQAQKEEHKKALEAEK